MPSSRPPSPSTPSTPPSNSTPLVVDTSNVDVEQGYTVTTTQGQDASGTEITHVTFVTTDPSSDIQVTQDLSGSVVAYYDNSSNSATNTILNEIKLYASKIQCTDFQGKGTIDDYTELFNAASKIANESKQMQLDVDIEGFNEFANAADDLSKLFSSFIVKLENVSIIDDTAFLTAVASALQKIWNLSEVFGKFKQTILATSSIQIPKSAHDTTVVLENVVGQINCAMKYISHFVDSTVVVPDSANLSQEETNIIQNAVTTIDHWNTLCEQGVSIAMANNPDIQYIKTASDQLKQTSSTLKTATSALRQKLAGFNINT